MPVSRKNHKGHLAYLVEAIRVADNARVIYGPFAEEVAAQRWKATAEAQNRRRHQGWEFEVQYLSPRDALALLWEVE